MSALRERVKAALRAVAPSALDLVSSVRSRRRFRRAFASVQDEVAAALYPDGDIRVLSGPFRGTAYDNGVVWGPITPRWLGTYEAELWPVVERIASGPYRTVVDVGSAEGYYAVGLARRLPGATVHSFDTDPFARRHQRRLARRNGLDNVVVGARCTHADLDRLLADGGVVVCDVEGHEAVLLDPARAPALRGADVLVEVHPHAERTADEVRELLLERFAGTHRAEVVEARRRDPAAVGGVAAERLGPAALAAAVAEHRPPGQQWLWLEAAAR